MRYISLIFAITISSVVSAQEQILRGDSQPIKLSIGQNEGQSTITKSLNPGDKIQGTSGKTNISIGLQNVKSQGSNSTPIRVKIGQGEAVGDRTTSFNEPSKQTQTEPQITSTPNYYSLIIGVDKYQFASANLFNLNKPIKDATTLRDILVLKYSFQANNSTFLQNPTRADILRAFEDLAKKVTEKDNVLIFYAGHGYWDERLKVGYWLPSDSKTDDKSGWIANSTIRDYIAGIQSKHTLLISDACFSGSIFKTREVNSEINEWGVAKIYQLPSRKAMTSGTLTTVPDESKFMEYLVKRLNDNSSKYLTTRQLFYSLETAVLNNTSTVPQLGVIQDTGDEGGDFIFIKR
jgi:hypothetical protein